ncbi:MAG: ABC transporter substrate-binding protein [Phycisphaeraceae bacterium]
MLDRALLVVLMVMLGFAGDVFGEPQRIASLAPALSRMIVDLGAGDRLVAVSEYDTASPEGLPVLGSMAAIDRERLIASRPTDLVHMGLMGGQAERLPGIAERLGCRVHGFAYPNRVEEVMDLLAPSPLLVGASEVVEARVTVGGVLGLEAEAAELRAELEGRLERVRAAVAGLERRRVLLVFGVEPVAASGPGTVLDQMLVMAGGRNALGERGATYQTLDFELLHTTSPEVVFLLLPGASALTEDDARLVPWVRAETPAGRDGAVYLFGQREVLLPSTRLVGVVEEMARVLHPEAFEAGVADEGEPDG